ncbi:6709_t:CDS:1, partial [Dentiscutata erythropus]
PLKNTRDANDYSSNDSFNILEKPLKNTRDANDYSSNDSFNILG